MAKQPAKKAETKVVEAKKKVAKVVKDVVEKKISKEEAMLQDAKKHFRKLQHSWFEFAKTIWEIKNLEAYKEKYDSFKDYCQAEYPSMEYTVFIKYCIVIENFGRAIEDKLKKEDESYILPSYQSFYLLANKEKVLEKEDLSRLRKMVLDAKIGFHSLRESLAKLVSTTRAKESAAEVVSAIDDIESTLAKELEPEISEISDEDMFDSYEESESEEDDIIEDGETESEATFATMKAKVDFLIENIPDFENELSKKVCAQDDAIELAESMNKLHKIMDKFLNKFEKLSE